MAKVVNMCTEANLYKSIQEKSNKALKNGDTDARKFYNYFLAKCLESTKNPTDSEVRQTAEKLTDILSDLLATYADSFDKEEKTKEQIKFLKPYIRKPVDREQFKSILDSIIDENPKAKTGLIYKKLVEYFSDKEYKAPVQGKDLFNYLQFYATLK